MLRKAIEYTDYFGNNCKEDYYFHLNKTELLELEMNTPGGLAEYIQRISDAQDGAAIIKTLKEIVLMSYGERTPDGKRFIKKAPDGHKLCDDFEQTEAFSELFMELVTNADAAAAFINGIIPAVEKNNNVVPFNG